MDNLLFNTAAILDKILDLLKYPNDIPVVYDKYLHFFPILVLGFIATLLLTPVIGLIAKKLNILDRPASERGKGLNKYDDPNRHLHKVSVPFLGGLAVIIPLLIAMFLFLKPSPELTPIIIGVILLTIAGILDDAFNLPATVQLIVQIIAASLIAFSVINFSFITNPFGGVFSLDIFTSNFKFLGMLGSFVFPGDLLIIPWIILCINALKWTAGSDGVLESNSIVIFALLFVLGIRNESSLIAVASIVTLGSLLGFMVYHFPPAKIHSGCTAKTVIGFLIASLALVNGAKIPTTIIILALPIADAFFVLGYRAIKFRPKNPVELMRINDSSHLHHQLIRVGFTPQGVLFVESALTLAFGLIAVLTTGAYKLFGLFAVLLVILIIISLMHFLSSKKQALEKKKRPKQTPESKYSY
ncbi:undecaprenyl/decaprenyl-phosphate alpha-N-acetylglucosaminyl 1-phosphate transferase [Candidatus Dojkabacteria bacterium]|jgi:UDP-GlcNAc:undecaprenyl-phosphate GlcNAc-1-phosphate transferase|nr:undecaprenyl/decaprenyl-phosphate alpha-N-acetylglucosaminyl 1-phosphate transferase [Candidatus Dojkabacteria bacterium]